MIEDRAADEPPINCQVGALLPVPGKSLLDQLPPPPSHLGTPWGIVEQAVDELGHLGHIPRPGVGRSPLGEGSRLLQVEAHEGHAEGHVLHALDR